MTALALELDELSGAYQPAPDGPTGTVLSEPTHAALLEAFVMHARALTEFFWKPRDRRTRATDARAGDWFDNGQWDYGSMPGALEAMSERVGWGVAHVSYRRDTEADVWGWDHNKLAGIIANRAGEFFTDVAPDRLGDGLRDEALCCIKEYFGTSAAPRPWSRLVNPTLTGTPPVGVKVLHARKDDLRRPRIEPS